MFTLPYRIIATLFSAVYLACTINACNVKDDQVFEPMSDIPVEEQAESETIHILQSRGDLGQHLQQAIDLYATPNGNAKISVQTVGNNMSEYQVALRSRLLSGEKVDIYHIFGMRDALELASYTDDLSDLDWAEGAPGWALEAVRAEDKLFGIPYSLEGFGLIANRNIFELAGIPLADITRFEDLEEAFVQLDEMIQSGELAESFPSLQAVAEFPAQDSDFLGKLVADVTLTNAFDGAAAAQDTYLNLPMGQGANRLVDLLARYSAGNSPASLNSVTRTAQIEDGFAAQRIAVILDNMEVYSRIYSANPNLENRLGLLPVSLENEEEGPTTRGVYANVPVYWAVNANSTEGARESARRFLTWLYQSETGSTYLAARFKIISPYRETAKDTGVSIHNQFLSYLDRESFIPAMQNEFPQDWGREVFAGAMREYLTRDITWEELEQLCREQWHSRSQ